MNVKSLLILFGVSTMALLNTNASAKSLGGDSGGGGGAFVCRNSNGKILSAELVDMYEARNQLGLKIQKFENEKLEGIIESSQLKAYEAVDASQNEEGEVVDKNFATNLKNYLEYIKKVMRRVDNVVLENSNDFQMKLSPKTCPGGSVKFEQLAYYTPTNELLVDDEIYASLSTLNKAALELHEALYLMARQIHGSESSLESRRAVGYLLSTVNADKIPGSVLSLMPKGGAPNEKWVCATTFIPRRCFDYGCNDVEIDQIKTKNGTAKYGKSQANAWVLLRYNIGLNAQDFIGCTTWTSKAEFKGGSNTYVVKCIEPASIENSCFQQF